ncbi:PH domain containing protein [Grosmannia clavigera kw1407]|uniref:PH domain containing protein n=1 Tax=Grosmannia clavigera (strain kw1407 / UAMH 11150) TaxID=655863 RepID=F0XSC9_GROCL|nr:PH domain containing protein [Grosmannia clavigera kw1407]EFW99464.1 PH domain containing protein [Grosmannia clavigera kw1407]
MSQLSSSHKDSLTSAPSPPADRSVSSATSSSLNGLKQDTAAAPLEQFPTTPVPSPPARADSAPADSRFDTTPPDGSPISRPYRRTRSSSRPLSMVQTYRPFMMEINDTIPELQPIFSFLNNHGNKLYQEGYFLKLDDQNTHGRPNVDRTWTECFAQLVGTVLSLWDASELDTAGDDGEVLPKFINLTDASIKMIESLPTRTAGDQPLQNVLSVSTAGRNRYLLHFNSHHSLIQWTASIRLAMFEQSTLQEAYTGALIAGKGKAVNNINLIMERSRFKTEEWVRVRFGSGVPWRRCWCVISPPNEKEVTKLQKDIKKRSPYDRSHTPLVRGDIKFYDTRKTGKKQKKAKPIATLSEAYSAYAIYPQSKALIDASTLVKIEGSITIHSNPPSTTEGFVFIMPEVHPAVTGFEMLLRFLFPAWDAFGLYGRPGRLVASVLDQRSLMFALPKHRRYGYLETSDVASLLLTEGSSTWTEREWRKRMKEATGQHMAAMDEESSSGFSSRRTSHRSASYRSNSRFSFGLGGNSIMGSDRSVSGRLKVNFTGDRESDRSSRSIAPAIRPAVRTDSAPPASERQPLPSSMAQAVAIAAGHGRNLSDTRLNGLNGTPRSNLTNPLIGSAFGAAYLPSSSPSPPTRGFVSDLSSTPERVSSEDELPTDMDTPPAKDLHAMAQRMETPEPVHMPPAFSHSPSSGPPTTIYQSAELRRANSRLSHTTLAQIAKAGGVLQNGWADADGQERQTTESGSSRSELSVPALTYKPSASTDPLGSPISSLDSTGTNQAKSPLTPTQNNLVPAPDFLTDYLSQPTNGFSALPPLQTSPRVLRKPVPAGLDYQPQDNISEPHSAATSLGSIPSYLINEAALDQVRYNEEDNVEQRNVFRQNTKRSEASSRYDDASSTASPDYASTLGSNEPRESVERPRAGVLRTVGETHSSESGEETFDIPEINFGPTLNYAAQASQRNMTPTPFSGPSSPPTTMPARKPTRDKLQSMESIHRRQESEETIKRRSVAWQPAATIAGGSTGSGGEGRAGALTPEQFVLQRAAQASISPMYSHQRVASTNSVSGIIANNTSSPTLHTSSSYDMLNSVAGAQLQRPSSQGANSALGLAATPDVGSHLSAREQEYLARMTGGPLINMAGNHRPQPSDSGPGLARPPLGSHQSSYGQVAEPGWAQPLPGTWPAMQGPMQGAQQVPYMRGGSPQQGHQSYGQYPGRAF